MDAQQNLRTAEEIYAAFGRGDIGAILGLLAEEVHWVLPGIAPFAGERRGREQVRKFFDAINASIEVERFDPQEYVAQGDHVIVLGEERFRVRRTGGHVEQRFAHAYTLQDGKVTCVRLYEDTEAQAAAFSETAEEGSARLGPMGVTEPPYSGRSGPIG